MRELYVKDDSVNHPTCSYKDRVVSVAATRAVELGFTMFACASTGNLAGSVAAHAARLGLACSVFIPDDLEPAKVIGAGVYRPQIIAVRGNYDDVNRLCTQVADRYGWGFANINLRAYYAEGAKTYGFEIAEQLGWRFPRHVVSPVAGGTLLPRILKGFEELRTVGLVDGELPRSTRRRRRAARRSSARSTPGWSSRIRSSRTRSPSRSRSAIPADGFQVLRAVRETGGGGAMVTDDEIIAGIQLLAETEGIFTEPAGGATVAATKKLIERGALPRDESIVICITGNGYKTAEVMNGRGVDAGAHRSIARGLRGERRRAGRDVVGVASTTCRRRLKAPPYGCRCRAGVFRPRPLSNKNPS